MSEVADADRDVAATETHQAHPAHLPAQADDLNTPVIAVVGFVSAILTFAIVIGLQAGYHQFANALHTQKVVMPANDQSAAVINSQKATMNSYGWVNKEAGTVSLPIDRAMQLVVNEYSTKSK